MHSRVHLLVSKSVDRSVVVGGALAAGSSLTNPSFTSDHRFLSPTWLAGVANACQSFLTPLGFPSRPIGYVKFYRPRQPLSIAPRNRTSIATRGSPGCGSLTRPIAPSRVLVVLNSIGSSLARSVVAVKCAFHLSMPLRLMSVPSGTPRGKRNGPPVLPPLGASSRWRRQALLAIARAREGLARPSAARGLAGREAGAECRANPLVQSESSQGSHDIAWGADRLCRARTIAGRFGNPTRVSDENESGRRDLNPRRSPWQGR
jgi:hypothetical protein